MNIAGLPVLSIQAALQQFAAAQNNGIRPRYLDWIVDEHGSDQCVYYHDGDLHCDHLDFEWGVNLLVNGNLYVKGDVITNDDSELIVIGNMQCHDFLTYSSATITGNLLVERYFLGDSECDLGIQVGGTMQANFILNDANCLSAHTIEAPFIFNSHGIGTFDTRTGQSVVGNVSRKTLEAIFPDNFDFDDLSYGLANCLEQGIDPLKPNAQSILNNLTSTETLN